MAQKTKVDYVRFSYTYGSEARAVETKPVVPRIPLPKINLEKFQKLYVDPLAVGGIAAAILLLAALISGCFTLYGQLQQRDQMKDYLSELKHEKAQLNYTYHSGFDAEEVRQVAERSGLVDAGEAEHTRVYVTVPEAEQEMTWWEETKWVLSQLFAGAKR